MSYHILNISEYGCKLLKENGFIVCKKDEKILGKMALADVRAIVLANEAVSVSGALISALSDSDAIILHCKNFKPIGLTLPLCRVYNSRAVLHQAACPKVLNAQIWQNLLRAKIANQAESLERLKANSSRLTGMLMNKSRQLDEARSARDYWDKYFPAIGAYGERRTSENKNSKSNVLLNYGYGVVGSLIYRAVIVHGLSPLFGVNHKTYYKNKPLVYDLIEPFRAVVDIALAEFLEENVIVNMNAWAIKIGKKLRELRVKRGGASVKIMDAIDVCASSLANAYNEKSSANFWVPYLNEKYRKRKGNGYS